MFYTKLTLTDGELITHLTEDNIYCTCPICGKEIQIDLEGVLKEDHTTLQETAVYCEKCSKRWFENIIKSEDRYE